MKIKFLMAGLLGLISATSFAQKGELNNAETNYNSYLPLSSQKVFAAKALSSLNDAKTSIDKAAANEKTAALPKTFALKAAIYATLANKDSVETTSLPLAASAIEAEKKAKELDTKGEFKKFITDADINLSLYYRNKGVAEFQNKKYDAAYKAFDQYRQMMPDSADAIHVTGLAAANNNNYPAAIANYTKLLTTNYADKPEIYYDLSSVYLANKDTANAIKTINEGSEKYPANDMLTQRSIIFGLQSGNKTDVINKLQAAITKTPENKTLYYYEGWSYIQLATEMEQKFNAAKDLTVKTGIQQKRLENYNKAAEILKIALQKDPNYYEANLNMAYAIINPAIDNVKVASLLPVAKQKEYNDAMAKAGVQFDQSKPFIDKAVASNPKSKDALSLLKTYYIGKKDNAHSAEVQKQIDAIQ